MVDTTPLKGLQEFFEEHHLFGVPVVDAERRIVGVVLPSAVEEESSKQKTRTCGFFFVLSFASAMLSKLSGI